MGLRRRCWRRWGIDRKRLPLRARRTAAECAEKGLFTTGNSLAFRLRLTGRDTSSAWAQDDRGIEVDCVVGTICWPAVFLSPLRGFARLLWYFPRLAPWAVFFRRFAAGVCNGMYCGNSLTWHCRLSRVRGPSSAWALLRRGHFAQDDRVLEFDRVVSTISWLADFLSPIRGFARLLWYFPRLAPWAVFFRRFAAGVLDAHLSGNSLTLHRRLSRARGPSTAWPFASLVSTSLRMTIQVSLRPTFIL